MPSPTPARPRVPLTIYIFGALAELLFGYDTGIIGVSMLSIKKEFDFGTGIEGLIVSSLLLGAAVGVAAGGRLADRYGRRRVIFGTGIVFALGGAVAFMAPGVWTLIAARFVMGLGVGASASVVSVYLVEVAPTRHRGKVGSMGQLMVVIGVLLAYGVGYLLQSYDSWRWLLGLSVVPALVLGAGVIVLPETPRWLLLKGREDEARRALQRLGRGGSAEAELATIRDDVSAAPASSAGRAVLRRMASPSLRPSLYGAVGLALLAQLVGTNSIMYFAPSTLVHAGFGNSAAVAANLGVGTANVVFTLVGMAIVDRVGRRPLLMAGCAGMAASMIALAVITALGLPRDSTAWLTLLCMIGFLASFAASWGVCVRVVISELFPAEIRGSATGFVLVLNWLSNFAVSQLFPTLMATSAVLSFSIFGAFCLVALAFVRALLPETGQGRDLETRHRESVRAA
ncbi:sugar porter family MFS transporter [Streptomyces sp. NPDC057654]|uniref:sugar porter family MFS transporter n=1 Tax=Streptomyces sp. NPDC057654 TaxID=3346196 RepID=UPI0036932628